MRRFPWIVTAFIAQFAFGAEPQTNTNVVSSAEDAFGVILGPESLGLYSQSSVRGFSPITAGNVRLDGLYFDLQGAMTDRLVMDTRIRVGPSAVNYLWPAPTGIVDYTLRRPGDTSTLTSIIYLGPYSSRDVDVDGYTNFPDRHLGIGAGISYHDDEAIPGLSAHTASLGLIPQWTPSKDLTVRAFWGRENVTDSKNMPIVYVAAGQSPPHIRTRYFGQPWARVDNYSEHYGVLAEATLNGHWSLRVGAFHSIFDLPRSFSDLYLNTSSAGIATHRLVAEPNLYYGSTSGELQLSHTIKTQEWTQRVDFGARARSERARYGGAEVFDFGTGAAGAIQPQAQPHYVFGATTADRIHECTYGTSYTLGWDNRVKFTAALQRPTYSRSVSEPGLGRSNTSISPWLYDSSLVFFPTKDLAIFGALTRGLEDSGVAPSNAVNRGEVLNAARSSQEEIGVKYPVTPSLKLLVDIFDIKKPYFALDNRNVFGSLGQERHRGLELSLAGELNSNLHLVAGAVFMSPEVTAATSAQHLGSRPIGQPSHLEQLGLDYRAPWLPALSIDGVLGFWGRRTASGDNRVQVPGYGSLDLGGRYRLTLGNCSGTLRVQVTNVTNTLNWLVDSDGGLVLLPARRAWAYLIVDF